MSLCSAAVELVVAWQALPSKIADETIPNVYTFISGGRGDAVVAAARQLRFPSAIMNSYRKTGGDVNCFGRHSAILGESQEFIRKRGLGCEWFLSFKCHESHYPRKVILGQE
jgi:hypothetical protein